jgi:AcrR family transcriptional regulator
MTTQVAPRTDRRHLRRAQTLEQIVDVALEVMAEDGVAGMSLGEVARRIGIRTPSLYVYFPSKSALYDAVFARGWREVGAEMERLRPPQEGADLRAHALEAAERFTRWMVRNPVHAQLMSWRPVPGYQPSPEAYEPAVQVLAASRERFAQLQSLGLFRPDVPVEELLRAWTVLVTGLITQQLANAPQETYDTGAFTALLPALVDMHLAHYAPVADAPPQGRGRHADARRPGR